MNKKEYSSIVMKKAHEFYKKQSYSFSVALRMAHYWAKEQKNRIFVEYFNTNTLLWQKWATEFYTFKAALDGVRVTYQFSLVRIKNANDKVLHNYNFKGTPWTK